MSTYTYTELENEAYKLSCLLIFILELGKRLTKDLYADNILEVLRE